MTDQLEVHAQRTVPRTYQAELVETVTTELLEELRAAAAARSCRLGRTVELWVHPDLGQDWPTATRAIIRAAARVEPIPAVEPPRARQLTAEEHVELSALSRTLGGRPDTELTPAQLLELLRVARQPLAERLIEHFRALADEANRCYVEDHPRQVAYWRERALLAESTRPSKPYRGARSA